MRRDGVSDDVILQDAARLSFEALRSGLGRVRRAYSWLCLWCASSAAVRLLSPSNDGTGDRQVQHP